MESNNLIHPSHHGFRSGHNTIALLAELFETWAEFFKDGRVSAVILLDLNSAFDFVDHAILLKKLKVYGFEEHLVIWIYIYVGTNTLGMMRSQKRQKLW